MNLKKIIINTTISLGLIQSLNAQTIELDEGWNLIGITETTTSGDVKIKDIVDNTKISTIYSPLTGVIDTKYIEYNTKSFVPGYGYWIKASATDATLSFSGISATFSVDTTIQATGWNLISFDSTALLKDVVSDMQSGGYEIETIYSPSIGIVNTTYIEYNTKSIDKNAGYYFKINTIGQMSTGIETPPDTPSLDDNETTELSAPPSVPSI